MRVNYFGCNDEKTTIEWQSRILWAAEDKQFNAGDEPPKARNVMILINPFGGAGAAAAAWRTSQVLLENANLNLTVKETERAMHAYEIA